jgi:hypothetical protein
MTIHWNPPQRNPRTGVSIQGYLKRCWAKKLHNARAAALVLSAVAPGASSSLLAQGTTTSAIRGAVHLSDARQPNEVRVRIINIATGYAVETRTRNGNFFVQGLIPGGPYTVEASSVGYVPRSYEGVILALGEQREVDLTLVAIAGQLDTVTVRARNTDPEAARGWGVGTAISDSALHRLPTLNRDLYDFVRLVPQAGTRFGLTGSGASFRYNSYLIDGISDRQLQGNNVMGASTVEERRFRSRPSRRFRYCYRRMMRVTETSPECSSTRSQRAERMTFTARRMAMRATKTWLARIPSLEARHIDGSSSDFR